MDSIPEKLRELLEMLEEAAREDDRAALPVRLKSGQAVRLSLKLDEEGGFKSAGVSLEPSRAEKAAVAALVALKGGRVAMERVRPAIRSARAWRQEMEREKPSLENLSRTLAGDSRLQRARTGDVFDGFRLEVLEELLRRSRSDFDKLPENEQIALLEQGAERVSGFLDALDALVRFVEDGGAQGNRRRRATQVREQVRAAELKDVLGHTYAEVGEALGLPRSGQDEIKGDHRRARETAGAGRQVLASALGEEGYRRHVEEGRAAARRWSALTEEERFIEVTADRLGVPAGKARQILTGDFETEAADLTPGQLQLAAFARAFYESMRDA